MPNMKRKTTWAGKKSIESKVQNQNIIKRPNLPGKWLDIWSKEHREVKCYLGLWKPGN